MLTVATWEISRSESIPEELQLQSGRAHLKVTMYETELKNFSIGDIAESGQCFRIVPYEDGFLVNAFGKILKVWHRGSNYRFSCSEDEFNSLWRWYFDLDTDYGKYMDLALPGDEYLKEAIRFGSGIRILNQDPWEMLISFIISQRKSVSAIRTSVERLSRAFGEDIDGVHFAFPQGDTLAEADTDALSSCGLGYRMPYVMAAAKEVAGGALDLKAVDKLETQALISRLMELKGVGIKVASCVALFGFHRLDALPLDVWMKRVIKFKYDGYFPDEYRPYAGALQQYMFNYARLRKVGTTKLREQDGA